MFIDATVSSDTGVALVMMRREVGGSRKQIHAQLKPTPARIEQELEALVIRAWPREKERIPL